MNNREEKTGTVSLIGKTNVGKSTLLNQLIEQKVSITSRKPQTTRQRLLGIKTTGKNQIIFEIEQNSLLNHKNFERLSKIYIYEYTGAEHEIRTAK